MPEPIHIDKHHAVRLLRQVVREHGRDTRYYLPDGRRQCVYQIDGCPSCIVGHALSRAGVTGDELAALDAQGLSATSSSQIDEAELPQRVRITDSARRVLVLAQIAQDAGDTWGDALDKALHEWHRSLDGMS